MNTPTLKCVQPVTPNIMYTYGIIIQACTREGKRKIGREQGLRKEVAIRVK